MNTVVVDFYLSPLKDVIIELERKRIISNKFWLVDERHNDSNVASMHNSVICEEDMDNYYTLMPDEIYNDVRKSMYQFMNIDNRWINSVEMADYVHDFNILANFWYGVFHKENIELVIMGNAPHCPIHFMCYLVAKSMNLKLVICEQLYHLKNAFICADSIENMGKLTIDLGLHEQEKICIKKEFKKSIFYMKDISPVLFASDRNLLSVMHNFKLFKKRKYDMDFFYKGVEKLGYCLVNKKLSKYFNRHRNDKCQQAVYSEKYVYFPLHLQPEMTTDTLGGIYEDQLLAIERVRRIIPNEWYIYIKENPKQTYYKRSRKFFERLSLIPNIKLVYPDTNTWELIKYSQFVATITGTVGWEAITGGKNVLVFGYVWYRTFPGVFEYENNFDLNKIMSYKISHHELEYIVNNFYNKTCVGVITGDNFKEYNPDYDEKINNEQVFRSLKTVIEKWYKR